MCDPVTTIAVASVVGAGASYVQGQQQAKKQKKASQQAQANADKQAAAAEQDFNRRNQKQPNTAAMAAANQQSAQAGVGSTMLTGSSGVNPNDLVLGRNTLLGM